MAEEVDALLKDLRKKNSAKRRAIILQEAAGGPAVSRANGKTKDLRNFVNPDKGLLKNLDKVLVKKTDKKKQDVEEIVSRINGKK